MRFKKNMGSYIFQAKAFATSDYEEIPYCIANCSPDLDISGLLGMKVLETMRGMLAQLLPPCKHIATLAAS